MSKYASKILSLDGGGIKGIIPCMILKYIEERTKQPISGLFNLLAGTSTGGIIALGLTMADENGANNYSADDMLKLYAEQGKYIFAGRSKDFKSWLGSVLLDGALDKDFDVAGFERILSEKFGHGRLKDALTDVLVTTYEPQEEKPFYFSSRLAKKDVDEDFPLREIARSTSAAPTYFKPAKVKYENEKTLAFVDGGVFANNPSVLAYGEAKELWKEKKTTITVSLPVSGIAAKTFEAVVAADDKDLPFFMLSIGCGHSVTTIDYSDAADWRTKDWIKPLLTNVFMQSVSESTDYTMQYLLPPFVDGTPRYKRLNLSIPEKNSEMDDASDENIRDLQAIARKFINDNQQELDAICELLMQ